MPSDRTSASLPRPPRQEPRRDDAADAFLEVEQFAPGERKQLWRDIFALSQMKEWASLDRWLRRKKAIMANNLYRREGDPQEYRLRTSGQMVALDHVLEIGAMAERKTEKLAKEKLEKEHPGITQPHDAGE